MPAGIFCGEKHKKEAGGTSNNNRRIAKNALAMYVRMFVATFAGLYTSRVVLRQLGITDYGIYEVVGGVASMFGFLNGTLAVGTQRFLTYALGQGDRDKLRSTFSTSFNIHLAFSFIVGILILSAGMYLISSKLVIPADRLDAARFSLCCCTVIVILSIVQVPYAGLVVAHERMGVYAYISILGTMLKLGAAVLLSAGEADRLRMYAFLMVVVEAAVIMSYIMYCRRSFDECRLAFRMDWGLARGMGAFAGWNIIGSLSNVLSWQGLGIVLNMFIGPAINTAQGLAGKMNALCNQFVASFQSAVNPQIVKYWASGKREEMLHLIYNNARLAGVMILLVVVPVSTEAEFLLKLWLGHYPEQTVMFVRIVLVQTVLCSMSAPLVTAVFATAKMKAPSILSGGVQLLILPAAYVMLRLDVPLRWILTASVLPWILATFIEVCLLKRYIGLSVSGYYRTYMLVILIGAAMSFMLYALGLYMTQGWLRLACSVILSALTGGILAYQFALTPAMRRMVSSKIAASFRKNEKR